jgi:hypothetical protein
MSTLETPMIRRWWGAVGGRICEEYPLVPLRTGIQTRRRVDAIVRPDLATEWVRDWRDFGDVHGTDVIVVQAKASGLGLPLMGQAFFSAELARRHLDVASAHAVLLCSAGDDDLAPLAAERGVDVVVQAGTGRAAPFALRPIPEVLAAYHRRVGGTIAYGVPLVPGRPKLHRAHAVVLPDGDPWDGGALDGRDGVLVTSPSVPRPGMWSLGQALFGAELLRLNYRPRSVRSVIVALTPDTAIGELADRWGIETCVIAEREVPSLGRQVRVSNQAKEAL